MFWTVEINLNENIFGRALKGQPVVIECYTPFNKEQRADAKSTTSYFLLCNFWTHDDNIRPKFKKLSFAILEAYNMFDKTFSNIFSNILISLCRVYFGGPRNVGPRK